MIDPETAAWAAEFVLLHPDVEDWLANEIILALPLSFPASFRLRRAILLRRLASDLSRSSPCFRALHSLDILLDDLSFSSSSSSSSTSSESIAIAYRAVALHCVAGVLPASDEDFRSFVDGLCSRVAELQRMDPAIVAAEPLRELRMEIEAAAGSSAIRAALLGRDTRKEALDAVSVYLKCARKEFQPSSLDLVSETVSGHGIDLETLAEVGEKDEDSGAASGVGERASGLSDAVIDHGVIGEVACLEMSGEGSSPSRDTLHKYVVSEMAGEQDGALQLGKPSNKFDPLPTPACEKWDEDSIESSSDRTKVSPLTIMENRKEGVCSVQKGQLEGDTKLLS